MIGPRQLVRERMTEAKTAVRRRYESLSTENATRRLTARSRALSAHA
jgi:hypothetical protein